jgi:hypothetical protein
MMAPQRASMDTLGLPSLILLVLLLPSSISDGHLGGLEGCEAAEQARKSSHPANHRAVSPCLTVSYWKTLPEEGRAKTSADGGTRIEPLDLGLLVHSTYSYRAGCLWLALTHHCVPPPSFGTDGQRIKLRL